MQTRFDIYRQVLLRWIPEHENNTQLWQPLWSLWTRSWTRTFLVVNTLHTTLLLASWLPFSCNNSKIFLKTERVALNFKASQSMYLPDTGSPCHNHTVRTIAGQSAGTGSEHQVCGLCPWTCSCRALGGSSPPSSQKPMGLESSSQSESPPPHLHGFQLCQQWLAMQTVAKPQAYFSIHDINKILTLKKKYSLIFDSRAKLGLASTEFLWHTPPQTAKKISVYIYCWLLIPIQLQVQRLTLKW